MLPRGLLTVIPLLLSGALPALTASESDLIRVLQQRHCPGCKLADADLVHADLRDADLSGAQLQRANLARANLDGADLSGADLSFTNLQGASLRGADLRGSRLYGTDLRQSNLAGAKLSEGSLEQSHWAGARGIQAGIQSHAALHNAGVNAAESGRWPAAERLFSEAIAADPNEPLSWVARGLCRGEQGEEEQAARDLNHAAQLYAKAGDSLKAEQLKQAGEKIFAPVSSSKRSGNGVGSTLLNGALSTMKALAPFALKALAPMIP